MTRGFVGGCFWDLMALDICGPNSTVRIEDLEEPILELPERLDVACAAWARGSSLHELAGRHGALWFGSQAAEVVRARQRVLRFLTPNPNSAEGVLWGEAGGRAVALLDYDLRLMRLGP